MGLKIPNLDNQDYAGFRASALAKLPAYAPDWTDHNASDPGITIVELLAWIADINSYRLDRIREEHYLAFLKLLDESPRELLFNVSNEIFEMKLGDSSGYAKQSFQLPSTVIFSTINLTVGDVAWSRVDEFFSALPEDRVYTIHNGTLLFGDGAYGAIPPRGEPIVIKFKRQEKKVLEEIDEVFKRVHNEIKTPFYRASTLADYEKILLEHVDFNLARVKAWARHENNSISLVVVPNTHQREPKASSILLKEIKDFLEERRLLTTQITSVKNSNYTPVNIKVKVKTHLAESKALEEKIKASIERFLHPIYGGLDGEGWQFGEDLHISHIYMLLKKIEMISTIEYIYFGANAIKLEVEKDTLPVSGRHRIVVERILPQGVCS